jgi:hypothetical protein
LLLVVTTEQDKFMKMVFQAIGEWWTSLGVLAWLVLGILLAGGIILLVLVLRRVLRGGLSRHMPWSFPGQRIETEELLEHDPQPGRGRSKLSR